MSGANNPSTHKKIIFFIGAMIIAWIVYMFSTSSWHVFREYWIVSVTMVFGSIIAGFSAEGGGAVAFPIFTKLLEIAPSEAKEFSLLCQSFGMGMASLFILLKRTPIFYNIIIPSILGGIIGQCIGAFGTFDLASPQLKWLFSITAFTLAISLTILHYTKAQKASIIPSSFQNLSTFFLVGILGGWLSINIGCGADILAFIFMTIVLKGQIKIATPTSVIIMAINSIIGVCILFISQGKLSEFAIKGVSVSVPIVIIGAPLGAYLATKSTEGILLVALLSFIAMDVISTIIIVPFPF